MNISSVQVLSDHMAHMSNPEEIKDLLLSYGNQRETKGIESGWQKCSGVYQRRFNNRTKLMKKFIPGYDPDGTITLNTFNKVFWNIFDELKDIRNKNRSIKDFQDFLFTAIGDIRVDRRLCFLKE